MPGRKKKPAAQRKLEGTKVPFEREQAPATGLIPDWVPADGQDFLRAHGDRIRVEMGVKASDEPMLYLIATAFGNAIAAQRVVNSEGTLSPDCRSDPRKNPAGAVWRAEATLFIQMATKFGLSPVDRLRLMQPPAEEKDDLLDGNHDRSHKDWLPRKVQ